jgi:hypothetical protein
MMSLTSNGQSHRLGSGGINVYTAGSERFYPFYAETRKRTLTSILKARSAGHATDLDGHQKYRRVDTLDNEGQRY